MNIKIIEKKFYKLGFWLLEFNGSYKIQSFYSGNILENEYNIEQLESKLEELEKNMNVT